MTGNNIVSTDDSAEEEIAQKSEIRLLFGKNSEITNLGSNHEDYIIPEQGKRNQGLVIGDHRCQVKIYEMKIDYGNLY